MDRVYFYNLEVGNLYRTIQEYNPEIRVVLDILQPISNALMIRIPLKFYYCRIVSGGLSFSDLVFNTLIHNRFILSDHQSTKYTGSSVVKYNLYNTFDFPIQEMALETIDILGKRENKTEIEEWNLGKLREFYQGIGFGCVPLHISSCESLISDI